VAASARLGLLAEAGEHRHRHPGRELAQLVQPMTQEDERVHRLRDRPPQQGVEDVEGEHGDVSLFEEGRGAPKPGVLQVDGATSSSVSVGSWLS
jgi:hypothetical protein